MSVFLELDNRELPSYKVGYFRKVLMIASAISRTAKKTVCLFILGCRRSSISFSNALATASFCSGSIPSRLCSDLRTPMQAFRFLSDLIFGSFRKSYRCRGGTLPRRNGKNRKTHIMCRIHVLLEHSAAGLCYNLRTYPYLVLSAWRGPGLYSQQRQN